MSALPTVAASVEARPRWRGGLHAIAFWVVLAIAPFLVAAGSTPAARWSLVIYLAGLEAMFGVSALYHRGGWSPAARARMSRLDHGTIFLAIAGTYTPLVVLCLTGPLKVVVLVAVWAAAVIGIAVQWVPRRFPPWATASSYVLVGWVAVIALPQLWRNLGVVPFFLVLAGGLAYTVGAVVYARRRPDPWPETFGFHEVFHACTIAGAGLQMLAIALVV